MNFKAVGGSGRSLLLNIFPKFAWRWYRKRGKSAEKSVPPSLPKPRTFRIQARRITNWDTFFWDLLFLNSYGTSLRNSHHKDTVQKCVSSFSSVGSFPSKQYPMARTFVSSQLVIKQQNVMTSSGTQFIPMHHRSHDRLLQIPYAGRTLIPSRLRSAW